jgi:hypothetical protein
MIPADSMGCKAPLIITHEYHATEYPKKAWAKEYHKSQRQGAPIDNRDKNCLVTSVTLLS